MADTISITQGNTTIVVTPIRGSVRAGGGHEDRGGGVIPSVRAGIAKNGTAQVVIVSATSTGKQQTLAEILSVISEAGEGAATIQGAGLYANIESYDALVDVEIGGDSVQVATINWKGTYAAPAASSGTGD